MTGSFETTIQGIKLTVQCQVSPDHHEPVEIVSVKTDEDIFEVLSSLVIEQLFNQAEAERSQIYSNSRIGD